MKKILFILAIASFFAACTNSTDKRAESSKSETISINVDEFAQDAGSYIDQEITIKGLVTHVCKHGGQKLFVAGTEEGISIRIEVGEGISEFTIDMEGSDASFTGLVKLMDDEFIAEAVAEHEDHHGDEELEGEELEELEETTHTEDHSPTEKTYYMVATGFEIL